jgi:hypothetical protein
MIRRQFTHTFNVDLVVTREDDEFIVTAKNIDSDGGEFHVPYSGPTEYGRVTLEELLDDPIIGADIEDVVAVTEKTEAAVILYLCGEPE